MIDVSYTTEEDEFFFSSIGRLTISWAILELGIDYLVRLIHEELGGKNINPVRPWALQKKLEYMRRCFRSIEVLQPHKEKVLGFSELVTTASVLRHDIIHGIATSHKQGATVVQMARLVRGDKGNPDTVKRFSVTGGDILTSAIQVNRLHLIAFELTADVGEILARR
jgi:hypothetical protein